VPAEIRNDVIVATEHIKAPPDVVFSYFTDPALIVTWIGDCTAASGAATRPLNSYELDPFQAVPEGRPVRRARSEEVRLQHLLPGPAEHQGQRGWVAAELVGRRS
jgi:uncharacterized protein YndB with AHSA1/START domain